MKTKGIDLIKKYGKIFAGTTVGCFITGFAIAVFYHHSQLISGGVTGVAMILNYKLGWSTSLLNLLLNIPIFIAGFIFLGKKHIIFSIYGTIMVSLALQFFEGIEIPYESSLTTVLLGGAICGFGSGIMLRSGGTSGGTDIVGKILNKYFSIAIGTTQMAFNVVMLIVYGFLFDLDLAILTMATSFVASVVNNYINDGIDRRRVLYIVTSKPDQLAERIGNELKRGVTSIPCEGGTTHLPHQMLYVVISKFQLAALKRIIRDVDPEAFFTIQVTTGVYGKGRTFHAVSQIGD
ncbi:MAG: YitT family protein [Lachnospiraceae bacterium]|nr:YitT family protein [Lachnospiraceae bacterium]